MRLTRILRLKDTALYSVPKARLPIYLPNIGVHEGPILHPIRTSANL